MPHPCNNIYNFADKFAGKMGQNCTQEGESFQFKGSGPAMTTQLTQTARIQSPKDPNRPFTRLSPQINDRLSQLRYNLHQLDKIEQCEVKRFANGMCYQGPLEKDAMNGIGRLLMPDGSYCQGSFLNNRLNGEGLLVDSRGNYYLGEFKNNKAEGNGKYVGQDYTYEGQFKNNMQSGYGRMVKGDEVYEGTFHKAKKKKGRLTKVKQGTVYEGDFQYGVENGYGRLTVNGEIYEGWFYNGVIEGQGKVISAKGETSAVLFKNGKRVGKAGEQLRITIANQKS